MNISVKIPFEESPKTIKIFLAGGCTTNWRDDVINCVKTNLNTLSHKATVEFVSPVCHDKTIKLFDLLKWEHDNILSSDILVINFEASSSVQPGSLYELGRYVPAFINKKIIINADTKYLKYKELCGHVSLLSDDFNKNYKVHNFNMCELGQDIYKNILDLCKLDLNDTNIMHSNSRMILTYL